VNGVEHKFCVRHQTCGSWLASDGASMATKNNQTKKAPAITDRGFLLYLD
jgi:hypothetical protein